MEASMTKQKEMLESANKTGVKRAPEATREMLQGARDNPPSSKGGPHTLSQFRERDFREAVPLGSYPSPPDGDERMRSMDARGASVFLDRLGERLVFERSGVRLYEALVNKVRTSPSPVPFSIDELRDILEGERRHFHALERTILELGGDPTQATPSADVTQVVNMGIPKLLLDPRSTVDQCLSAMLTVEATDNEAWELLVRMAHALGFRELEDPMLDFIEEERDHLEKVKRWLGEMVAEEGHMHLPEIELTEPGGNRDWNRGGFLGRTTRALKKALGRAH